jgi:hypothetical protein
MEPAEIRAGFTGSAWQGDDDDDPRRHLRQVNDDRPHKPLDVGSTMSIRLAPWRFLCAIDSQEALRCVRDD